LGGEADPQKVEGGSAFLVGSLLHKAGRTLRG